MEKDDLFARFWPGSAPMIAVGYDGGTVGLRGEAANLGESLGILSD